MDRIRACGHTLDTDSDITCLINSSVGLNYMTVGLLLLSDMGKRSIQRVGATDSIGGDILCNHSCGNS